MSGLLGAGILVMIVADTVVGLRLVNLARRTRGFPELAIGSSLFLLGGLGYPLAIAARNGVGGLEGAPWLLGAALACQNVACLWMAVGTWKTFHPDDPRSRAMCVAVLLSMAVGWTGQAVVGFSLEPGSSVFYWFGFAGRVVPFAWTAWESWRYHAMLRKRLALGLADPVVTDRFRLWASGASAVTAGFLLFMVAAVAGIDVAHTPWVLVSTSAIGCISGVSFWLAFLPPRSYLRRFEAAPAPA